MPFELLEDFLLIEEDKKPEKYGSLFLPEGRSTRQFIKATVIVVGDGDVAKKYNVGDRILKLTELGSKVRSAENGKDYFIMPTTNVMCRLTGEEALKTDNEREVKL